jgi:hypothetical protein
MGVGLMHDGTHRAFRIFRIKAAPKKAERRFSIKLSASCSKKPGFSFVFSGALMVAMLKNAIKRKIMAK